MADPAPAVVQQGDGEVQAAPVAAEQKPLTREEVVGKIREGQLQQMASADRERRLKIARRGYRVNLTHDDGRPYTSVVQLGPSVIPTDEELRAMVPMPEDRLNYTWANPKKGTAGVVAENKYGLISVGRPHGRKKPHMSKRKQLVHGASLRIYKKLFAEAVKVAEAAAAKDGKPYAGVPEDYVQTLAAKSLRLGAREVYRSYKAQKRHERRIQQASRSVNNGLLPGNQVTGYINRGGEYGR